MDISRRKSKKLMLWGVRCKSFCSMTPCTLYSKAIENYHLLRNTRGATRRGEVPLDEKVEWKARPGVAPPSPPSSSQKPNKRDESNCQSWRGGSSSPADNCPVKVSPRRADRRAFRSRSQISRRSRPLVLPTEPLGEEIHLVKRARKGS